MRVLVRSGHFAFYPGAKDDVLKFKRLFGIGLVPEADYMTFEALAGLPRWSQVGRSYGGLPAVATFEGRSSYDVMGKNGFVFSLFTKTLIPLAAAATSVSLIQTRDYAVGPLLVQPGAVLTSDSVPGNILLGYSGKMDLEMQRLYIDDTETLL